MLGFAGSLSGKKMPLAGSFTSTSLSVTGPLLGSFSVVDTGVGGTFDDGMYVDDACASARESAMAYAAAAPAASPATVMPTADECICGGTAPDEALCEEEALATSL